MNMKRSALVATAVAAVAVAGLGTTSLVSAASTSSGTSLVDKIASKFNLQKSDVQAVFDQDRQEHQAQMEADQKQRLADAVKNGKLTQAQADHITQIMNEIKSLRGSSTSPRDESSTVRSQIKTKMDDLRTWAQQNNVDMQYVMGGHGRGMRHGFDGPPPVGTSSPSDSSNSSSNPQ
jgi:cobalamin biosynthesis Mg chelatase CobN